MNCSELELLAVCDSRSVLIEGRTEKMLCTYFEVDCVDVYMSRARVAPEYRYLAS